MRVCSHIKRHNSTQSTGILSIMKIYPAVQGLWDADHLMFINVIKEEDTKLIKHIFVTFMHDIPWSQLHLWKSSSKSVQFFKQGLITYII